MAKHKHADLMIAYAQDAQESDTPWQLWEILTSRGWSDLHSNPNWDTDRGYRRKIKTIRIGEYDVPEPLRVAPVWKTPYFFPSIVNRVSSYTFTNDSSDNFILDSGMMHLTHEAAELHGKALISLIKP